MPVYRVTTSATLYSQVCQNVMHFDSGDSDLTEQTVFIEIRDNWIGVVPLRGIQQMHTADTKWINVDVKKMTGSVGPTQSFPMIKFGQQGNEGQLRLTAGLVLRFPTATAGRSGHGRVYLMSSLNGFTSGGVLNDNFTAFCGEALAHLRLRFLRSSVEHGPLVIGVAPRNDPSAFKDAINILASPTLGNQRRRNIGRGL